MNIIFAQTDYTIRPKLMKIIPSKRFIYSLLLIVFLTVQLLLMMNLLLTVSKQLLLMPGTGEKMVQRMESFQRKKMLH